MKAAPVRALALTVAVTMLVSGCATTPGTPGGFLKDAYASDDPCSNNARNIGVTAGVIVGALLGAAVSNNKKVGALVGAGVGAAAGGLIGYDVDRRRCELARIAKKHGLEMTVTSLDAASSSAQQNGTSPASDPSAGLVVAITDRQTAGKGQFAHDSATLLPEAHAYFLEIGQQYSSSAQSRLLSARSSQKEKAAADALSFKRILLVGHTDDSGGTAYNASLSEQRARAVAAVFREAGVSDAQLFYQGAGETLPVADNHTDEGRGKNRRVEIVDLTDDASFKKYLDSRRPNLAYYRNAAESPAVTAVSEKRATTSAAVGTSARPVAARQTAAARPASSGTSRKPAETGSVTSATSESSPSAASGGISKKPEKVTGATQPTATLSRPHNAAAASAVQWDFGGAPTRNAPATIDLGKLERSSGLSIISTAVADTPIARCDLDRPRAAHAVKSLRDDKEIPTSDYMPGLYNTSWTDTINGNLVALTNVAVLRDGGAPARRPTLLIYRNYSGGSPAADLRSTPEVNTYRGDKALLYRIFVGQGAVQCMDIVIPHASPSQAKGSWLRYEKTGELYSASFQPELVKPR